MKPFDTRWLPPLIFGIYVAVLLTILIYAWGDWDVLASALLVATGAFVSGGILGFLFGIPRALAGPERPQGDVESGGGYAPNTNLEQISDWLTKILVGVGLVQATTIAGHLGDLIDFLGPPLGGDPYGETVAAATLVIFGVSGFLVFYLLTRTLLPSALAQADRLMVISLRQEIAQVRETQRNQQEDDVNALTLVLRQLDPEPGAPDISPDDLNKAIAAASPLVKTQIFGRAREQRRLTRESDPPMMERTIPVFRALIASETDQQKFHRNHAQLGYALKDKTNPELQEAETALTEAIELRDDAGERGFLLYEFNRALVRIGLHEENPSPELRAAIEADLKAAEASASLRKAIASSAAITEFRTPEPPTATAAGQ
jgi:hypothetical protein